MDNNIKNIHLLHMIHSLSMKSLVTLVTRCADQLASTHVEFPNKIAHHLYH